MSIVAAVLILMPGVPPVLRAMFAIPNTALQNAMACRVYRQIKLGLIKEDETSLARSSTMGAANHLRFAHSSKYTPQTSGTAAELDSIEMNRSTRSQRAEKHLVVRVDVDEEIETGDGTKKGPMRHDWDTGHFA